MVLTDGSTQYPKKVFEDRNPDKQVIDFENYFWIFVFPRTITENATPR